MSSKPYSELEPIDRSTFRRHALKFLILQSTLSLLFFCILHFLNPPSAISLALLGLVLFVLTVKLLVRITELIERRFKDVYPDTELNTLHQVLIMMIPVFFFSALIFFFFKRKTPYIRKSLPLKYSFLGILPVICLQLISPSVSYMTNVPMNYFTIDLAHSLGEMKKYDGKIGGYHIKKDRTLAAYQSALLFLVSTSRSKYQIDEKFKHRNDKISSDIEFGVLLAENSYHTYFFMKETEFHFLSFSPFHWCNPVSLVQIAVMEWGKRRFIEQFQNLIVAKKPTMMARLEKEVGRLPANLQPKYRQDIERLRLKFHHLK